MPIIGPVPAAALATARRNAKLGVRSKWQGIAAGLNRPLTDGEQAQMATDYEVADAAAILAFLQANMIVTTPPGGGIGIIT